MVCDEHHLVLEAQRNFSFLLRMYRRQDDVRMEKVKGSRTFLQKRTELDII